MIECNLEAHGLQWRAALQARPLGRLFLGPCSLDLIEKGARSFHRLKGVPWEGSEAAEAIETAAEAEAAEARGRRAEGLASRLGTDQIERLRRIHRACRGSEVIRG